MFPHSCFTPRSDWETLALRIEKSRQGIVRFATSIRSPEQWSREAAVIALLYTPNHYRWIRWTPPGPTTGALIEALAAPKGGLPPVAEIQIDARPPVMMDIDP